MFLSKTLLFWLRTQELEARFSVVYQSDATSVPEKRPSDSAPYGAGNDRGRVTRCRRLDDASIFILHSEALITYN